MLHSKIVQSQDYSEVIAIWERSVQKTHQFLVQEDIAFYRNILPQHFQEIELRLWSVDNQVIGFSGTSKTELVMLFLDPAFIGKSYGSRILEWLIEEKRIDRVDVNTQNTYAKAFYIKYGFKVLSEDAKDGYGKEYPITHLVKDHQAVS
ncbi:GNAT family N-acetyltransferase [Enterococcus sp.]|uniref:GNAT family N-acetyltransferase n=1 Tax=Enterococcus sp. TaxID=35783 RepID=UPI0025BB8EA7|nr:GNAT family N-acetyltransferase [Enterococcus sp.]